ncbi:MAG: ATP-binding protein [Planctomycetia bacterium]|nr:ATP-binding protein [Planctomycetia bacterium]
MRSRGLLSPLVQALRAAPCVLLAGARQTGKSTLVRSLEGAKREYITFDEDLPLAAARANPAGFLAGLRTPCILDEVQKVPELFPALKLAVDRDRRAGRFLLTGSANVLLLPRLSESLAGRMRVLTLGPLTQGEIGDRPENSIDAWFDGDFGRPAAVSRAELARRILRGGYPEPALHLEAADRPGWFASYVATILARDVRDLADIDRSVDLRRLLALAAARSSSILNYAELANAAALPQSSLKRYLGLLSTLFLVRTGPAWSASAAKSLARRPRVFHSDTGLMIWMLGLDETRLAASPDLLGPLLETFVANELTRQAGWSRSRPSIQHFRDRSGAEVDLVLEDPAGRVVGVEVKAGATAPGTGDLRGLRALAAAAGKGFERGLLLYGGDRVVPMDARIHAVPISSLWS